jgi:hypothetical protein
LRVLYVAGMGRSGTTLVARLFGEVAGVANIGEALRCLLHSRLLSRATLCGCGTEIDCCPFWRDVQTVVAPEVRSFATSRVRVRHWRALAREVRQRALTPELERVVATMGSLLQAVARRTGCDVIVDASKNPATGLLLTQVPGIEVHVLHLVCDPRSVVRSWSRPKQYLRRHGPLRVTAWWLAQNLCAERLAQLAHGYLRVRCESTLGDLPALLDPVLRRLGIEQADLSFIEPGRVYLTTQHTLAGNPDKFSRGWIPLRPRASDLSPVVRWGVSLVALPLLWRYGYLGRGEE